MFPSQLDIQRLQRAGVAMPTNALRIQIQKLNDVQSKACDIGEKLRSGILDKPIKEAWNGPMKGGISKATIVNAITNVDTLKDDWAELHDSANNFSTGSIL